MGKAIGRLLKPRSGCFFDIRKKEESDQTGCNSERGTAPSTWWSSTGFLRPSTDLGHFCGVELYYFYPRRPTDLMATVSHSRGCGWAGQEGTRRTSAFGAAEPGTARTDLERTT